jgi:2-dehydro-3-deoxyphosphogluconate aldolase/(4S)-4-hydroxy-2-oxoglutarate aldolase
LHRATSKPRSTPALLDAASDIALPWLPGAATASEAMQLAEHGYVIQKCFPATAIGGIALLRSLAGPLPAIRFCPTGGITAQTAPDFLALSNVVCVGGSWLTPKNLLAAGDWQAVETLAREAARLQAR